MLHTEGATRMNPTQRVHLLCALETLVRAAAGTGDEYEYLILIETIIKQASDEDFKDALAQLRQLRQDIDDEYPLGIVGDPIAVLN